MYLGIRKVIADLSNQLLFKGNPPLSLPLSLRSTKRLHHRKLAHTLECVRTWKAVGCTCMHMYMLFVTFIHVPYASLELCTNLLLFCSIFRQYSTYSMYAHDLFTCLKLKSCMLRNSYIRLRKHPNACSGTPTYIQSYKKQSHWGT